MKTNLVMPPALVLVLAFVVTALTAFGQYPVVYKATKGEGTITLVDSSQARLSKVELKTEGMCIPCDGQVSYSISGTTIKFWSVYLQNGKKFSATITSDGKKITLCGNTYIKK
jgi:hypothetical protein